MKVLLLNPPTRVKGFSYLYPLSLNLAYLGDALLRNGFDVRIRDLSHEKDWTKILSFVKNENPDVVGLSCFSDNRGEAYRLIRLIKELDSNIKIITGGHFFSALPVLCLKHFDIDAVITGEGEKTIVNLVKAIEKRKNLKSVRGVVYKEDGKIKVSRQEEPIKNLDELPVPDFKTLINKNELNLDSSKEKLVPLLSMRGCIFRCSYCSTPLFDKNRIRVFSPERVVEEIRVLKEFTGNKKFIFWDPILTFNKNRTKKLCNMIIKNGLELSFWGQTRPEFIFKETCGYLKKARFSLGMYFGVESVKRSILLKANRTTSLQRLVKAFKIVKYHGLSTKAGFIIGLEGDSLKNVRSTVNFIKKIDPDSLNVNFAAMYPGTPLYELAKTKGLISDEFWLSDQPMVYYTGSLSIKEMLVYRFLVEFAFYKKKGKSLPYLKDQLNMIASFIFGTLDTCCV